MKIDPFLLKALIVPLAVATVVAMAFGCLASEPWAGLAINLAAGFIGTGLTVFYFDVVLRRHEMRGWRAIAIVADRRAATQALACLWAVRTALLDADQIILEPVDVQNEDEMWTVTLKANIEFAAVELPSHLHLLEERPLHKWDELDQRLGQAGPAIERILDTFADRLPPDTTGHLLDLQSRVSKARQGIRYCREFAGGPPTQAARHRFRHAPEERRPYLLRTAKESLNALLVSCATLLRGVQSRQPAVVSAPRAENTQPNGPSTPPLA